MVIRRLVAHDGDGYGAGRDLRWSAVEPTLDQGPRISARLVEIDGRTPTELRHQFGGSLALPEGEESTGEVDQDVRGHGVGRGADGEGSAASLGAPVGQRRVDRLDRDGRREGVVVEIADPRPRPNELPASVQEQRMTHGGGGGASRQPARAFGDRPGVAEFLGVGQGRHASSHGPLERLAPRDGLGEDGMPSLPASLLGRLRRQGRVQTWRIRQGAGPEHRLGQSRPLAYVPGVRPLGHARGTGRSRGGLPGGRSAGPAADHRGGSPPHLPEGVAPRFGASEVRQQPTDGGNSPGIHRLDPRRFDCTERPLTTRDPTDGALATSASRGRSMGPRKSVVGSLSQRAEAGVAAGL